MGGGDTRGLKDNIKRRVYITTYTDETFSFESELTPDEIEFIQTILSQQLITFKQEIKARRVGFSAMLAAIEVPIGGQMATYTSTLEFLHSMRDDELTHLQKELYPDDITNTDFYISLSNIIRSLELSEKRTS